MKEGYSTITLVVKDDFKDAVKKLASQQGRSVSNYLMWVLAREIERNKTNSMLVGKCE